MPTSVSASALFFCRRSLTLSCRRRRRRSRSSLSRCSFAAPTLPSRRPSVPIADGDVVRMRASALSLALLFRVVRMRAINAQLQI